LLARHELRIAAKQDVGAAARHVGRDRHRSLATRLGDELTIFGAKRPSASKTTYAAETEVYDQHGDLVATGTGTFRYLKGERTDGSLTFLDRQAAD